MTATTQSFFDARPRIHPDVVLGPRLVRGATHIHLLKDTRTGRRMEVGAKEYFLISRLNGLLTLLQIGDAYAAEFGTRLGQRQWGQLLHLLHGRGLLDGTPASPAPAGSEPERPPNGFLTGRTTIVSDAPALMDRLHRATAFARRPAALTLLTALAAAVLVAVALQIGTLWRQTAQTTHQPVLLFAIGCVLWCSLALHELAHGLFARAWDGRVNEIGLRWIAGATYLYCEIEDVQFLGSRGRKVATACAGTFANILFLVPFYVVWALLPDHVDARHALGALLFLGTVMGLANLLPLPPLDGYKALSHAAGVVDLAGGTRTFLGLVARALVRRGPGIGAYPGRLRLLYGGFGLLVVVQTVVLLLLCGEALRAVLPDSHATLARWLPFLVLAALLVLRTLGSAIGARRARRAPATETTAHPPHPPRRGDMPAPHGETAPAAPRGPAAPAAPAPEPARARPVVHTGEDIVVLEGVTKRYEDLTAVDQVSLTVRRGEFLGILGPNGAGKTTLVEIVGGLRQADAGRVTLFGQSPWPRDASLLARIGVQTQASAFFARLTAEEHLSTVAALYGLGRPAVDAALRRVQLTEKARTRVDDLSGGQRQRVAIATALLHEPELIFFDEPTAALDPEARRELWGLLRDLHAEGRTIVYTTHHLEEAEALCDRVAIITGGRIAALDSPRNLIRALGAPARLLLPAGQLAPATARTLDGVDRVTEQGSELVIETTAPNRVLTRLGELVDIQTVTVRTATLEDAYLQLTGNRTEHDR